MEDSSSPTPTSLSELLDRIVRLEKQVAKIDEEFTRFFEIYSKAASGFGKFDELLMHHCNSHDRQFEEAWARIKNLELTVFPNLAHDITALNKIIPTGESDPENQLDTRNKFPWNNKNGTPDSN